MTANLAVTAVFVEPGYGIQFTPVTPCRLVDTRQTHDPIQGGTSQSYILPQLGGCDIPSTAAAYSLNVTVVPHTAGLPNHLAYRRSPAGRFDHEFTGRTHQGQRCDCAAGSSNAVSVYVSNTSDVILDIDGYFAAPGSGTYQFYPLTPCRIVDTRNGGSRHAPAGRGTRLPDSAQLRRSRRCDGLFVQCHSGAVRWRLDYLTVWPKGETRPAVSTLNETPVRSWPMRPSYRRAARMRPPSTPTATARTLR